MFKKYWDIFGGVITGILFAILADFKYEKIQLFYSIIILMLVSIGIFRIIKQEVEKKEQKRKHSIIDDIVDSQKSIKAISLSQTPTQEGEKIGKNIINLWEITKMNWEKIKTFFDKFKGHMLTIALAILTVIEMCGAPINALFGGALTIKGVEVLPVVTLVCTAVVGVLTNGYTKEQRDRIKALFSKSNTNELVLAEIKKTIKEKSAQLSQFNKALTSQEHELEVIQSEHETLKRTLEAKREMCAMIPQLATNEDVQLASNAVVECQTRDETKKRDIEQTKTTIEALTKMINALKSQL